MLADRHLPRWNSIVDNWYFSFFLLQLQRNRRATVWSLRKVRAYSVRYLFSALRSISGFDSRYVEPCIKAAIDTRHLLRQIRQGIANNSKGTAFVVYEDVHDAKQACDRLNGFNFQNRYLVGMYNITNSALSSLPSQLNPADHPSSFLFSIIPPAGEDGSFKGGFGGKTRESRKT